MSLAPVAARRADVSLADLQARLATVESRVRAAVEERRHAGADPDDRFRGLYISEAQVDDLLAMSRPADARPATNGGPPARNGGHAQVDGSVSGQPEARAVRLAAAYDLDAVDLDAVLIAVAPDIDARFERLYAFLQDDVTRLRPSVGLCLELCGRSPWSARERERFTEGAPMLAGGILQLEHPERPVLSRAMRAPDRVIGFLLGSDRPDASLSPLLVRPPAVELAAADELAQALERGVELAYLRDRVGAAAAAVAVAALEAAGHPALCLDLDRLPADEDAVALMRDAVREAHLRHAAVVAGPVDVLGTRPSAIRVLADARTRVVLVGRGAWEAAWSERVPWVGDAPLASQEERRRLWQSAIPGRDLGDLAEIMAGFRLTPEQIVRAARTAELRARAQGRDPAVADLQAGARAENGTGLERLARRVKPRATWSDLVVTASVRAQLQELAARARHRDVVLDDWGMGGGATHGRGVTALFSGDPGTGKTMSAEVVAGELGLDLYVIDLSSVVDKYVGETEKNLDRIFGQADRVNGVLLFDEADALFGQRSEVSDARDRYANVEIAYLLQRMEQFDGLAILTTNLRANIDEAFLRRLDSLVDFPMPEEEDRLAIWRLHLPSSLPLADDVDLPFMARRFRLAGGHIRNICLTSAFLAAARDSRVTMADIVRAAEREYGKLGRLTVEAEFGPYLSLVSARYG